MCWRPGQAFARAVVDDRQYPEAPAIGHLVGDESSDQRWFGAIGISIGVRVPYPSVTMWAALFLLGSHESEAVAGLERVAAAGARLVSSTAQTTLDEWRAGRLRVVE
jgi:hypothetical protein